MVTLIEAVVAPLLHCNVPVYPEAVSMELPQLSTTFTTGVGTEEFNGAALPLPAALIQPLTVCVTVYVPAVVTVMEGVVAPLLHKSDPVKFDAVNTELPQLSATLTVGAAGTGLGAAVPVPGALIQPLTVCVTVYIPPLVTVIDGVVAPVLHNSVPVKPDAVKTLLVQLSVTATTGAGGACLGAAVPLPGALEQPLTVCVTV